LRFAGFYGKATSGARMDAARLMPGSHRRFCRLGQPTLKGMCWPAW
jgi:hypothetical protein